MEISEQVTNSTENIISKSSVMAPLTTPASVIVALHPLVIMNISEHWTRVRAQSGIPNRGKNFKLEFKKFQKSLIRIKI
jgi:hypothetical protein